MNVVNLAEAALLGFLAPLVLLELLAPLCRGRWPVQSAGLRLETRALPWILALLAGPALFFDATGDSRMRRSGPVADTVVCWILLGVWSLSYGVVLIWAAQGLNSVILH